MDIKIHDSRKEVLKNEFEKTYFADIKNKLRDEQKQYIIYPPEKLIFNAFATTSFEQIKVVIL
jgi:uracil-DNA glycosylase